MEVVNGIEIYRILCLGAGVQSTALALMIEKGELPPIDAAVFADTGWEPREVYNQVEWIASECRSFPVHTVSIGSIRDDCLRNSRDGGPKSGNPRFATLPLYTLNPKTKKPGILRRMCTKEYKIEPVDKFVKEQVLGLRPRQWFPIEKMHVHTLIGISSDEATRMKVASTRRRQWKTLVYPLCDTPIGSGKIMSRTDCSKWLQANYPSLKTRKSACIGCPYHSDEYWFEMKMNRPDEWADAIAFDYAIRTPRDLYSHCFLHNSRKPLEEVDLEGRIKRKSKSVDEHTAAICDGHTCFL